jgi:hypothetical protein
MSRRKSTNVRSCCVGGPSSALHPLSLHTAPQPGGSLSPICFASHRALAQLTSPCDSNRARPLHTFCGCLLGSAARQSISVAVPVTSCCNSLTSCDSWLAHTWVVDIRSGSFAGGFRSCRPTQTRAGCCRCTSPSSFFVWLSMLRLAPDWALPTFADLQSTMSNQPWASPLVLSLMPAIPLDSTIRRVWVHSPSCAATAAGSYMVARWFR